MTLLGPKNASPLARHGAPVHRSHRRLFCAVGVVYDFYIVTYGAFFAGGVPQ